MNALSTNEHFCRIEQGFEVFGLRNDQVEISLVPELGAKIISLINRRNGREWMWSPGPDRKLFRNQQGDDFARSTLIGWDECLPTIAPCTHRGRNLSDHGEVWSMPWRIDREAWQQGRLRTDVKLCISPFDFERTIELQGNAIRILYQLTNRSGEAEPFLWAMHPLAPVFPGASLELTPEARQILGSPAWLDGLKLGTLQPASVKTYAGPLREGRAAIFNPTSGDRLTFCWDTSLNNTLGVWLTRGGWHGHDHVALEPSNGCPDDLTTAESQHRCGKILAHSTLTWEVELKIQSSSKV